jgi:hypothetical protein
MRFSEGFWRRRPDLNRGWRFCRQGRDVYPVDSSCFLVGPTPQFFPGIWELLFPSCSQVQYPDARPNALLARLPCDSL